MPDTPPETQLRDLATTHGWRVRVDRGEYITMIVASAGVGTEQEHHAVLAADACDDYTPEIWAVAISMIERKMGCAHA